MKTLIPHRLSLGLIPALLVWPATILWAQETCTHNRTNRCNFSVPETTPTSDFILNDNGTAYHKKTGLTWKRCPEGWDWNGSTCVDNTTINTYSWSAALQMQQGPTSIFAGSDDWRLPNKRELASIVEKRNWDPAINATVFPNTPAVNFWSASPRASEVIYAWSVNFSRGDDNSFPKNDGGAVRLVRGGQQYSLLSVTKAGIGSGTVTSNLPGIDCGKFCQGSFANEMFTAEEGRIILMAAADDGSDFAGWEGCTALEGSPNECVLDSADDTRITAHFNLEVTVITVAIDIKPGSFTNSINPRSRGVIPVAILTTDTFDATTVDALSVEFGPDGATESHGRGHIEDVDGDGNLDLVLHFRTQDTGIRCGDISAPLTGKTFDDAVIQGSDSIITVGCK